MVPASCGMVVGNRRMPRRLLLSLALLGASPASFAADQPYPPVVTFAVYRNGENVGRHVLTFAQKGGSQIVTIDSDISVRAMGLVAYRYLHHGNEVWSGDQLQSLQTKTDDNGRKFVVSAQHMGANLKVERTTAGPVSAAATDGLQMPDISRETLPASIMPTSQWNIRQVKQSALLNTQYGTLSHVKVVPGPREAVRTSTRSVEAMRYTYSGDLRMDLWFDDRSRWVKGTFVAFDGSSIEYILQE
jgi:Domain of unknown function (DUF6134)